jgi:hypothetical protein
VSQSANKNAAVAQIGIENAPRNVADAMSAIARPTSFVSACRRAVHGQ